MNSYLTYLDARFDTVCTSLSYSHSMAFNSSQARHTQTAYPKRWNDSTVTIKFIFRSPQNYMDFGEFMRGYFEAALARNAYLPLRFVCPYIKADLNVIPQQGISLTVGVDTVAPTMSIPFYLVNNNSIEAQKTVRSGSEITANLFFNADEYDGDDPDRFYSGTEGKKAKVHQLANEGRLFVLDESLHTNAEQFSLDGRDYYHVSISDGVYWYGGLANNLTTLIEKPLFTRTWVEGSGRQETYVWDTNITYDWGNYNGQNYDYGWEYTEVI